MRTGVRYLTAATLVAGCTISSLVAAAQNGPPQTDPGPGSESIAQAQQDAAAAARLLEEQNAQLDDNQRRLVELSEQASKALELYDTAAMASDKARRDLLAAQDRRDRARRDLQDAQDDLSRWAKQSYQNGTAETSGLAQLLALGRGESGDYMADAWTLRTVGETRSNYKKRADEAKRAAEESEKEAELADQRARDLAQVAQEAKQRADEAVANQRAEVERIAAQVAATQAELNAASDKAARLAQAQAIADAAREDALRQWQNRAAVYGPAGSCQGGDLRGFANGQLPVSALCPLWGAPGHFLRSDAANAFEQMSKAYAQETGEPLCVTDSYRNYETQVRLKQQKPFLAARPGTSNHGWGRAIDFCGGINRFGTQPHLWMRMNAPLYGWYHPSWAQANGTKPEAWHWEFAG